MQEPIFFRDIYVIVILSFRKSICYQNVILDLIAYFHPFIARNFHCGPSKEKCDLTDIESYEVENHSS